LKGSHLQIREWGKWLHWNEVCWELDHCEIEARKATQEALAECYELTLNSTIDPKSVEYKLNDYRRVGSGKLRASLELS